jgi:hypothetical protein
MGQYERNLQHALAIERHPCSAVCLIQMAAGWQWRTAIEDPDVVESEESARKHVASLRILAVYPPVEVQHQPLEGAFKEAQVGPAQFRFNYVEE